MPEIIFGERALYGRRRMLELRMRNEIICRAYRKALAANDKEAVAMCKWQMAEVDAELDALEHELFDSTVTAARQTRHAFAGLARALTEATASVRAFINAIPQRLRSRARRKW